MFLSLVCFSVILCDIQCPCGDVLFQLNVSLLTMISENVVFLPTFSIEAFGIGHECTQSRKSIFNCCVSPFILNKIDKSNMQNLRMLTERCGGRTILSHGWRHVEQRLCGANNGDTSSFFHPFNSFMPCWWTCVTLNPKGLPCCLSLSFWQLKPKNIVFAQQKPCFHPG